MSDFPIGSFLYWRLKHENKDEWPVYQFIEDFDEAVPHNEPANMAGITRDVTLVLDGQQRITSLIVGLRGSFRYFYYRWRKEHLYLNLLKPLTLNDEDPEQLTYGFSFRESGLAHGVAPQLWYRVARILDFPDDAEDAKGDPQLLARLEGLTPNDRSGALRLIGRLHNRVHTTLVGNYYEERSQDYDKVLQEFVRANSGGVPLEYSDLLLATATARWDRLDARSEIHGFTDELNEVGAGYRFGKDFVLKSCLYLTGNLPIQYRVRNFSRTNLRKIEDNWDTIKRALAATVRLMHRFGFNAKNIVAPLGLLPVADFVMKRGQPSFDSSMSADDTVSQVAIRKWFILATLKNAFGGSSDTTLTRIRDLMASLDLTKGFPAEDLYKSLAIEPSLSEAEIERLLSSGYHGRYTYLVLSLLYPDRDWKDTVFHEDHIYPQAAFSVRDLKKRGYDDPTVRAYVERFNRLSNLQLITDSENLEKNATPFEKWLPTRDESSRERHVIPVLASYSLDAFLEFSAEREKLIVNRLRAI